MARLTIVASAALLLHVTLQADALLRRSEAAAAADLAACRGVHSDGFSRSSCVQDASPEAVRVQYDARVAKTYRREMTPQVCFDFCRSVDGARFFGIQNGRDCYCTQYYHDKSTGGGGCELPCDGDNSLKCGGSVKAQMFEMHMCGKTASLAVQTASDARAAGGLSSNAGATAAKWAAGLEELSQAWQLNVCSLHAPVCDLAKAFQLEGFKAKEAAQAARDASRAVNGSAVAVEDALSAFEQSKEQTAKEYLVVEEATAKARDLSAKAKVQASRAERELASLEGLARAAQKSASSLKVADHFQRAVTVERHHGICALAFDDGATFVSGAAGPAMVGMCAQVCLDRFNTCVGFNVQVQGSTAACQLLLGSGLQKKEMSLADHVPAFDLTATKREALGLDDVDCWLKKAWMSQPTPKKVVVLRTIMHE